MSFDKVIDALVKALAEHPKDLSLQLHLGELYLQAGRYAEALQLFQTVLTHHPSERKALEGAMKASELTGEHEKKNAYQAILKALQGQGSVDEPNMATVTVLKPQAPEEKVRLHLVDSASNVTTGPWADQEKLPTLDDVGGMQHVKRRLHHAFLAPLKNPELMKMYAKSVRGGLLLYGPPGCGKSFIARALAGELGAKFFSVGLSDVLDMWLGESERKLHEIFATARRNAPAVLFFDELDALGQKRSHLRHSGGRNIVNQLLSEMDSVSSDNRNLFILGATNHPWDVDTALRRPGRFDRVVLVLPPDSEARAHILRYHMKDRPTGQIDFTQLAQQTQGFSGADLAHVCESAVELALEDCVLKGNTRPVQHEDFSNALKDIRQSTHAWFETARNYAMFSNEGGMYDDLLEYIRAQKL